jgi:hypothetical protein
MLRALLQYFLIGGLLFAGKSAYDRGRAEGPELTLRVASDASDAELARAADEAILLNEARRYGWDRRDPVVFSHLVRNMRFIEPDSSAGDAALYRRALEMGMHEHDPIVRARLLYRAREALGYIPEDEMPTRDELEAQIEAHPERFEREGRARYNHVFLSRSKRGESLAADASAMRETLDELGEMPPTGLGDPLPGLRAEQVATSSKVKSEYGAEVAAVVEEAVLGTWRGPASSVYGLHFIRVVSTEPRRVPPLEVISAEVRADRLRELRKELAKERMDALRDAYTVHVERLP